MEKPASLREVAQSIFTGALADCGIEQAFGRRIRIDNRLTIDGLEAIHLEGVKRVRIVAVGKAAAAMLGAILPRFEAAGYRDLGGILIAPGMPAELPAGFNFFAGGHPLPNEASCAGARAALDMLRELAHEGPHTASTLCLFLISGGASAMMELPLDNTISLPDLINFHRELVHCGASIAEINCVRKHFSAVKGGRLAMAANGLPTLSLLVSDVPPACLDALGSGPTLPDTSTVEDCQNVLARYGLLERFPVAVRLFFEQQNLPETPKPTELKSKAVVLLSSAELAGAARQRAETLGFRVVVDSTCDDWDYRRAAEYLVGRLRELRRESPRVCLISPGEVTVEVSGSAGVGGRNQHFALHAATLLRKSDGPSVILSAGSDGIDGNSRVAGAVTDLQTLQKGKAVGLNAADSLHRFDSGSFLERVGDVIATGATGNNLRDLRILLADTND